MDTHGGAGKGSIVYEWPRFFGLGQVRVMLGKGDRALPTSRRDGGDRADFGNYGGGAIEGSWIILIDSSSVLSFFLLEMAEYFKQKHPEIGRIRFIALDRFAPEGLAFLRAEIGKNYGDSATIDRLIETDLLASFAGDKKTFIQNYFVGAIEAWAKNHD
jgi:hypothetical protein